jgi:phage protein D
MTAPSGTPVGPVVYQVTVNGVLQSLSILDVELTQCWGQHDIFTLRIEYNRAYPMATVTPWADNAMVSIVWGRRPAVLNTWYGYVNHHTISTNADSGTHNLQVTYTCIGMSKPMNSDNTVSWGSVTPTYIAKAIAINHSLRAVVTSTNWQLTSEIQAAESDFQFMQRIAQKTGYRFWVSNGTLYLTDPAIVLAGSSNQGVPIYSCDKQLNKQDTLRDFSKMQGDNLPGSATTTRVVYGIDQATGNLIQVAATGATTSGITQINTQRVARSTGEAANIARAWQNISQFWIGAKAQLFGSQALYPGKVVYLQGAGLPADCVGYWIVSSATHTMKSGGTTYYVNDKYMTECQLLRNSSGTTPSLTGLNVISPEFVACVNSNGTWVSTNQSVIVDGTQNV